MLRIKELRLKNRIKQTDLCKILGISQGNLSNWENGVYEPDQKSIIKLAEYFGVSVDYLLGRGTYSVPPYNNIFPLDPPIKLPIFGEIRAGTPINTDQGDVLEWEFADQEYGDGNHFMLHVNGDSMEPTIPNGSIVIIRSQNYAVKGQIVAFALDGEYATLKRIYPQPNGSILLRGDNPAAESYTITKEDLESGYAHIIGVVKAYKVNCK